MHSPNEYREDKNQTKPILNELSKMGDFCGWILLQLERKRYTRIIMFQRNENTLAFIFATFPSLLLSLSILRLFGHIVAKPNIPKPNRLTDNVEDDTKYITHCNWPSLLCDWVLLTVVTHKYAWQCHYIKYFIFFPVSVRSLKNFSFVLRHVWWIGISTTML